MLTNLYYFPKIVKVLSAFSGFPIFKLVVSYCNVSGLCKSSKWDGDLRSFAIYVHKIIFNYAGAVVDIKLNECIRFRKYPLYKRIK